MASYIFVFGRTPELSFAEVSSFFPKAVMIGDTCAVVNDVDIDPQSLMNSLGGSIKIAKVIDRFSGIEPTELSKYCEGNGAQSTFGLSVIGKKHVAVLSLLTDMKELLKAKGISARFVAPKSGMDLSSVVIEKNHVHEILAVEDGQEYVIAETVAVQPFEAWSNRDYGRPSSDAKLGMLPPKVARMMINIALHGEGKGKTIVDPFCGMGTILTEAMQGGTKAIGGDIAEDVVSKAGKNIYWIRSVYPQAADGMARIADATQFAQYVEKQSIDAVVTEPFMGSPKLGEGKISYEKAKDIMRGLEKLYIGCFRNWLDMLVPGGRICITFPSFIYPKHIITVKKVVDTCENLGYTKLLGPIEYGRPQAIVRRNIYLFEKA
jgi:tRNA G10  N-methylase Trm11